jgi:AraC-like DNA-binding protein
LASTDGYEPITFSTRAFAPRESTEAFRELFGRQILKLEMEPEKNTPFDVEMNVRALPGLAIATAQLSPMTCRHPSDMIDNDDPVFVFVQSGVATYRQNGKETTLGPGQAALTSNGLPGNATGHTATNIINWRVSRSLIAPLVPNLDDAIGSEIDAANPAIRLFLAYVGILNDEQKLASASVRRTVGNHLLDLGTLMLGARWDAAELAHKRGAAAARLHAIKNHIRDRLADPGLTSGGVAAKIGISTAYLRKLFEAEGSTFTEFVLAGRLSNAYRMLTDPAFSHLTISTIAHDVGFSDISYFNRAFRRAYGAAPSDVRGNGRSRDGL